MKTPKVKLSDKQYAAVSQWAEKCRATPEEMIVALALENLHMIDDNFSSYEEHLASTVESLREYVDGGKDPITEDGIVMAT